MEKERWRERGFLLFTLEQHLYRKLFLSRSLSLSKFLSRSTHRGLQYWLQKAKPDSGPSASKRVAEAEIADAGLFLLVCQLVEARALFLCHLQYLPRPLPHQAEGGGVVTGKKVSMIYCPIASESTRRWICGKKKTNTYM